MLRDMEETVTLIKKEHIKEYMKEALNCYNIGSYRGCVILSTIAAMHDLFEKIDDLGKSVVEARDLVSEIERKKADGSVYERYMVDNACSINLLTTEERKKISSYLDIRNQCAHPNHHVSTAEEARAVFMGWIDEVINKPALLGPAYIKTIISRLDNDKFFPSYLNEDIIKTVSEEVDKLHYKAIVPLADKIITLVETKEKGSVTWKNAAVFIAGMLAIIKDEAQLTRISEKFNRLVEKEELFDGMIVFTLMFPNLVNFLQDSDRKRYISHISTEIVKKQNIVSLLIVNQVLSQEENEKLIHIINQEIQSSIKYISGQTSRSSVNDLDKWTSTVHMINVQSIDDTYSKVLETLLSDGDYSIVNDAIKILKKLPQDFLLRINDKVLVEMFMAIINQANGPGRGADEANKLIETDFKEISSLLDNFLAYITKDYEQLSYVMGKIHYFEENILRILNLSQRNEILQDLFDLYKDSFKNDEEEIEVTLSYIERIIRKDYSSQQSWIELAEEINKFLIAVEEI